MKRFRTVDDFIDNNGLWPDELRRMREILVSTGLTEEVKWGAPCNTHDGKNFVGIGAFKSYFGLWFFKGAALDDREGVLINAQPGKDKRPAPVAHDVGERVQTRSYRALRQRGGAALI